MFVGFFSLLDPDTDPGTPLNPDRIHNTGAKLKIKKLIVGINGCFARTNFQDFLLARNGNVKLTSTHRVISVHRNCAVPLRKGNAALVKHQLPINLSTSSALAVLYVRTVKDGRWISTLLRAARLRQKFCPNLKCSNLMIVNKI
jgi:hypothetical protein